MSARKVLVFLSIAAILLAACTQAVTTSPTPAAEQTAVPAQAETPVSATATPTQGETAGEKTVVDAAIAALMRELKVGASQVKIITVEAVEWPDSCLGAGLPTESCALMVTPGYKVILQAGEKTYEYHTNQDGSEVRRFEDGSSSAPSAKETPGAGMPDPADGAQQALAQQLGLAASQVRVVEVEKVDWPDGCLGISQPGIMCTQAIVPGYRVILEAGGKQYEYRTDESGALALPAAPAGTALPQIAGTAVAWEQTGTSGCSQAEIGTQSVKAGACGAALKEADLSPERQDALAYLLTTYAPFSEETKAGKVSFNGVGSQAASEAEMRSIAEWAALLFAEAQRGKADPADGLAFNWHREGGIAGFCDDMTVYRSGWALARSCKGAQGQAQPAEAYRLSADELKDLYTWLDTLASFNYEHKESATADAMLVRLSLEGSGTQQASPAQQEEIAAFAAGVYANASNK